jgi:protein TonB
MSGLLRSNTDQYDVLGVAPDASADEIETAFDWLIRQKGYRYDVPLHRRPQRLLEIKAAYATLSDPAQRRAYDLSNGHVLESLVLAGGGKDAATDALVRPAKPPLLKVVPPVSEDIAGRGSDATTDAPKPRSPKRDMKKAPVGKAALAAAPVVVAGTALHSATTDHLASPAGGVGDHHEGAGQTTAQPVTDQPQPSIAEGPRVIADGPEAGVEAAQPASVDYPPTQYADENWAGDYQYLDDDERPGIPVKNLGAGAVVTLALAGILYASWPKGESEPVGAGSGTAAETRSSPATAAPGAAAGVTPGAPPVVPDEGLVGGEALNPEEIAAALADADAASASLREWAGGDPGAAGEVPVQQDSGGAPVADGQAQTGVAVAEANGEAGPAAQPDAPLNNPAAPPQAPADPSPVAATPATPTVTRTNAGAVVPAKQSAAGSIRPAKWISGGPADGDNRGGRYRGTVSVQFNIGTNGRVSNCSTVKSSGNGALDAMTCRIMSERGRFTPASDAQGRPVVSQAHATYSWGRGRRPKK